MNQIRRGVAAVRGDRLGARSGVAGGALPIRGLILTGIGLAGLLGGVPYAVYRTVKGTYHKLISSTDAVLDLAIKEALQWVYLNTNRENNTEAVSREEKLEWLGKYENLTQS